MDDQKINNERKGFAETKFKNVDKKGTKLDDTTRHFVRLRGLPYSASEQDIHLRVVDLTFTQTPDGRPSGECYVEFATLDDYNRAIKKDRSEMGRRYVEVFGVGEVELDQVLKRMRIKKLTSNKGFVRVRGLPFNCKKDEVVEFFEGLKVEEVVFGKEFGLEGRPTGDGFVQFSSFEEANRALELNGKHMGTRYIEIFKIDGSAFEVFKQNSAPKITPLKNITPIVPNFWGYGPPGLNRLPPPRYVPFNTYNSFPPRPFLSKYDENFARNRKASNSISSRKYGSKKSRSSRKNDSHDRYKPYRGSDFYNDSDYFKNPNDFHISPIKIFIRGLPFRVTPREIQKFFEPLRCVNIYIGTIGKGRSSGDGIAEFRNLMEAQQALLKDRQTIGSRYVELFPTTNIKIPAGTVYEVAKTQTQSRRSSNKNSGSRKNFSDVSTSGSRIPTTAETNTRNRYQNSSSRKNQNFRRSNSNLNNFNWSKSSENKNFGQNSYSSTNYATSNNSVYSLSDNNNNNSYASNATCKSNFYKTTSNGYEPNNSSFANYGTQPTSSTAPIHSAASTTSTYGVFSNPTNTGYAGYGAVGATQTTPNVAPNIGYMNVGYGYYAALYGTAAQNVDDYYKSYYAQNGYTYLASTTATSTMPITNLNANSSKNHPNSNYYNNYQNAGYTS